MKKIGVLVLGIFLVSMLAGVVSAAQTGVGQLAESLKKGSVEIYDGAIGPILELIIGPGNSDEIFFAKVLFLIILFAIIWTALDNVAFFSENTWVLVIVSIAMTILSIRWFGDEKVVLSTILPYSAFAITITAGLPFVIYFFFVKQLRGISWKIAWIFFAVVFTGLWFTRSGSADSTTIGGPVGNFAYIYLVTAILALIIMMMDGTIHRIMLKMKLEKIGKQNKQDAIDEYTRKIDGLPSLVSSGAISHTESDRRKKGYLKQIAWLSK